MLYKMYATAVRTPLLGLCVAKYYDSVMAEVYVIQLHEDVLWRVSLETGIATIAEDCFKSATPEQYHEFPEYVRDFLVEVPNDRTHTKYYRIEGHELPNWDVVLPLITSLLSHQVKGDDVMKALRAKGIRFNTLKLQNNYLGGWDLLVGGDLHVRKPVGALVEAVISKSE